MTARTSGKRGVLLSFEGPEGAGKSTHVRLLSEFLTARGLPVQVARDPGGTPLGEEVRRLVKHFGGPGAICDESELLLFGASRAQLVRAVIRPALAAGRIVICDRFLDSTTVYQGYARGLDPAFIAQLHAFALGPCRPDLTLLLDVDPATGLARCARREPEGRSKRDRIEAESAEFHAAVRDGFLALAAAEPERIHVIDAAASLADVQAQVMTQVERVLSRIS